MYFPIRERRKQLKTSLEKAAIESGTTVSMWYKIETAERMPSLELANRVSKVLDWTLDEFFLQWNLTKSAREKEKTDKEQMIAN